MHQPVAVAEALQIWSGPGQGRQQPSHRPTPQVSQQRTRVQRLRHRTQAQQRWPPLEPRSRRACQRSQLGLLLVLMPPVWRPVSLPLA